MDNVFFIPSIPFSVSNRNVCVFECIKVRCQLVVVYLAHTRQRHFLDKVQELGSAPVFKLGLHFFLEYLADGSLICALTQLHHRKSVSDAVVVLTEKLCGDGYLTENSNGVLVSVQGGDEALCTKIVGSVEKATERAGFNYAVLYQSLDDDADGKTELIAKLSGKLDNFDIEELTKLSVQELIFLAESLDSLPDKTEFYGKLNGYLSAEDAKHDAGVDSASAAQSIIRYAEQLAYEIVYTENGTTHKYIVSASTGEVLAHEKHGKSDSSSSGKKDDNKDDGLLSADDILKIFKKTFGFVDAVLDDVHVTRSTRNGEPVYIVTYKVFGVTRSVVFDARTAEMLDEIG